MKPTINIESIESVVSSAKLAEDFDLQKLMEPGLKAQYITKQVPQPRIQN
jgi:TATA-box binding protein (TBP) (component of TFIID and TFIIIB)